MSQQTQNHPLYRLPPGVEEKERLLARKRSQILFSKDPTNPAKPLLEDPLKDVFEELDMVYEPLNTLAGSIFLDYINLHGYKLPQCVNEESDEDFKAYIDKINKDSDELFDLINNKISKLVEMQTLLECVCEMFEDGILQAVYSCLHGSVMIRVVNQYREMLQKSEL